MHKFSESDIGLFLLGALVGIYGNWLISFFERLKFNSPYDWTFFALLFMSVGVFMTFSIYLITAFRNVWYPGVFVGINIALAFTCFVFQNAFSVPKNPLYENMIFWIYGVVILFSIAPIEWWVLRKRQSALKNRWKKPKIGILNDMEWNPADNEISSWATIPPSEWVEAFRMEKSKVELIDVSKSFDGYTIVLNPYGGVYPEVNLEKRTILRKIQNFVEEGGIFVNIADIPTYWAYHIKLKRKVETAKAIYNVSQNQLISQRPFKLTPLMKELGLTIIGIKLKEDFSKFSTRQTNIYSERFAISESNTKSLIPENVIAAATNQTEEKSDLKYLHLTGFFDTKYGEGDFIFSLASFGQSQQDKEVLKKAIIQSTLDDLKEKTNLRTQ
jgi:hypothetical protein